MTLFVYLQKKKGKLDFTFFWSQFMHVEFEVLGHLLGLEITLCDFWQVA